MAATRIIPMHVNKGLSVKQCLTNRIEYAENGEKTEDGEFFAVKTTKLVDQNAASAVADRRDSVRKKRAERSRRARQAAREAKNAQLTAQAKPAAPQGEKQTGRSVIRRTRRRRMMDR